MVKDKEAILHSHPDSFKCKRCGRCCRVYVPVTEQDTLRWAVEYRDDVLRWISMHDLLIHLVTKEGAVRCPFLRKLPDEGVCVCRIYDTRPEACAKFPMSRRQAERIGCPGVEQTEN